MKAFASLDSILFSLSNAILNNAPERGLSLDDDSQHIFAWDLVSASVSEVISGIYKLTDLLSAMTIDARAS